MSQSNILDFSSTDPFEYFLDFQGRIYPARVVRGTEGVSRWFRFEITYRTQPGDVPDPEEFVGKEAILRVQRGSVILRHLVGMMAEASIEATKNGDPELIVVLEPKMSFLRHRTDSRVFRDKTVPEIATEVLKENGIGVISRLTDRYRRRPFTVMYSETILDFIHRLLEEEGIFYFFQEYLDEDSRPEETEALHGIVLGDGSHAYELIEGDPELQLRATAGMERNEESVFAVKRSAKMRPGKVSVRDWNLEKPSSPMDVSADLARFDDDTFHGPELYMYPGKYDAPVDGLRLARIMAEGFTSASSRITGRSDTARMMLGRTLTMLPEPGMLAVGMEAEEIVILGLEHDYARATEAEGTKPAQGTKLDVSFDARPAGIAFRPLRTAPRPSITNPLTAMVVGPPGEDIHCDEFGRVKIQFPWDRYQAQDDHASHWVPVMQENTGGSAGIPRVGWEVVVSFVSGDPDRPFVLGRVYNGVDTFPEPLPGAKTKSALRSMSSPGRDGKNEIWTEDKAGSELMSMQAEKDQNVVVARNKKEDVKNLEDNTIVKDETILIGVNNTVTVKKQHVNAVDGNQTITVAASRKRDVKAADQVTVAKSRSTTIGSIHFRKVGGFDNVAEKSSLGETTGGVEIEASLKENSTNASMLQTLTVGGAVVEIAGQGKEERVEKLRVETIGLGVKTAVLEQFTIKALLKRATKVGMTLLAQAKTLKIMSDTDQVKVTVKDTGTMTGSDMLKIQAGGHSILLTKAGIVMESAAKVEITASGKSDLLSGRSDLL